MFELSLYSVVLLAHIAAGIVLVSSAVFAPLTRGAILRATSLERLRDWVTFLERSVRANPPAAMVVLASGLYMGATGWWSQLWFFVALGAWVANFVLATFVVKPAVAAVARAAASGEGPVDAGIDSLRRSRRWEVGEGLMRGNDFAMLYVMFVKPSLAESLLVVAAAAAVCVGLEWALTRRAGRAQVPGLTAAATEAS
jgi:hypothetical protein